MKEFQEMNRLTENLDNYIDSPFDSVPEPEPDIEAHKRKREDEPSKRTGKTFMNIPGTGFAVEVVK